MYHLVIKRFDLRRSIRQTDKHIDRPIYRNTECTSVRSKKKNLTKEFYIFKPREMVLIMSDYVHEYIYTKKK